MSLQTVYSVEFLVTRQSFVESALASPPICVLLHQLSPSSTCILDAGVFSRPSKTRPRNEKSPIQLDWSVESLVIVSATMIFQPMWMEPIYRYQH